MAVPDPYIVAIVGFGDAYLYCKGVLCYTIDHTVRVLNLHHSYQYEVVINIPLLLKHAVREIEDNTRGTFRVLYYSDKIISCTYKSSGTDSTAWLIAFSIGKGRDLVVRELDSTDKIFVRHNDRFLYYGTHSEVGVDGYKRWVIQGYDFQKKTWFDHKIHLVDMVGSEIGSTICFEFHNEYFYAVSNQTSFEVEEIDWTSFYHCTRFPLNSPCEELLEKTENHRMWRRQHDEGPIDDRWTSLRLDEDESTGELKIIESRKEWAMGSSRSQRTYYTTKIIFSPQFKDDYSHFGHGPLDLLSSSDSSATLFVSSSGSASTSGTSAPMTSSSSHSMSNDLNLRDSTSIPAASKYLYGLSTLPNDPILKLLCPDDNPNHMSPPPRRPEETHPGNDGSIKPSVTLSKCRMRHYHKSANAYLDLIDDPSPTDWQGTQRIRLRAGSRKLGPPLMHPCSHPSKAGLLRPPSEDLQTALQEMYREQPVRSWPVPQESPNSTADLDAVYALLNPPTHLGNVEGTADERSILYVTGSSDQPQAIVFIGFDPAMKLVGLKQLGSLERKGRKGVGEGPHIAGRATGWCGKDGGLEKGYQDVEEADRTMVMEKKGKGKEKCMPALQFVVGEAAVEVSTEAGRHDTEGRQRGWAWREKAMYRDIGMGFYFGLEKKN